MTATLTIPTTAPATIDPVLERASFFFDLEMAELTAVIPQAEPVTGVARY